MFEKQYRFYGSHAEKVSALTAVFEADSKATLFNRNLDVYLCAPLVGFLYNKKAERDHSDNAKTITPQNIFPEQMMGASDKLAFTLRLILLLDKEYEPDETKRLDKAFRYLGKEPADLDLFDSYVLGGVDVLYDKLIQDASAPTDYTDNLYDFLCEFEEKFNSETSEKDIVELCSTANR